MLHRYMNNKLLYVPITMSENDDKEIINIVRRKQVCIVTEIVVDDVATEFVPSGTQCNVNIWSFYITRIPAFKRYHS